MGLHYHKHQQNYLNKLNDLLIKNNYDFRYKLNELIYHINEFPINDREDILYNLGGVLNHELYWNSMSSKENNSLTGKFKNALEFRFKNLENFFKEFKKKALELKGSGYTFFVLKNDGDLDIIIFYN